MIPEQTVLVYEASECKGCPPANERASVNQLLQSLLLNTSDQDSLDKNLNVLFTPENGKAVSVHVISKDDFDAVYYFTGGQSNVFSTFINRWKKSKAVQFNERVLNGFKIQEFAFHKKIFSCVQLGDAWAGSFTAFLIEDVVRTYETKDEQRFKKHISQLTLPPVQDDAGNIYVHLGNLTNFLKIFPENISSDLMKLGQSSLLDIKQTENSITLNGFSLTEQNEDNQLLSYFKTQSPVQFNIKQHISNRTFIAVNYGISDGAVFYQNLNLPKNKPVLDSLNDFGSVDYANLFATLGKELAVCYQESRNGVSKVILFESQKPADWIKSFDLLAEGSRHDDTVFYENYSTYEIREVQIKNLAGKLFGPLIAGFNRTYYSHIGNYIILSENIEDMKKFLEDIDQENVWGKSVAFNKFNESTLLESNLSIYVNTPLIWNSLTNTLNPRWKNFVQENQALLNSFDFGAVQFSNLNGSFYSNITWTYSEFTDKRDRKKVAPSDKLVASLGSYIITSPVIVRSHVNGTDEVLVQDSAHVLYHISAEGKVLWQRELAERIVGELYQVDFFNNGKLQFFFATAGKLHVIDRLGNYVAPYPQEIKVGDVEYVSLIDYDNSKKYRFLIADKSGKLWMFDKESKNLEGWMPNNTEGQLMAPARHYRIRGKDYILAIRKDGYAFLSSRRGETLKGFPLNLEARPQGDFFLETERNSMKANFVCVSKDGFRIRFTPEGEILSRETLVKPSFETQFSLVAEQSGKSYVIKRQDAKKLTLLNEESKEILSSAYIGMNRAAVKYYDFGAGKIYFTITDLEQELSFIYDGKGQLLNVAPLQGRTVSLRPTRNEMPKIFLIDQNSLIIQ